MWSWCHQILSTVRSKCKLPFMSCADRIFLRCTTINTVQFLMESFPRNLKRNLHGNVPLLFSLLYAPIPPPCVPLTLATNKYHKMHFTCLGLNSLALKNSFTPQIFTKPLFTKHWLWTPQVPLTKRVSLKVGTGRQNRVPFWTCNI